MPILDRHYNANQRAKDEAKAATGVMTHIKQAEDMTAPTIKRNAAK